MSQCATKNASHHVSVLCLQLVCLLIMDAVKVVLIYTLMQTPVCIYKHNCFSIPRSRGEELHGGQQSFYCFHSQDVHCLPTSPPPVLVHVNRNFLENDLVCTTLFFKT